MRDFDFNLPPLPIPPAADSIEIIQENIHMIVGEPLARQWFEQYVRPVLGDNPTDEHAHHVEDLITIYASNVIGWARTTNIQEEHDADAS